jgi:Xaa-Pro aminopeptidase
MAKVKVKASKTEKRAGGEAGPTQRALARLEAVLSAAGQAGADALLVTNPKDVGYLTGFGGEDSWLVVARIGPGGATLLTDFRFQEEAQSLDVSKGGPVRLHVRAGTMLEALAKVVAEVGADAGKGKVRLGVQGEHLTLARRAAIAKACKGVTIVETSGLTGALRIIKDEAEVKLIRKAVKVQEEALEEALRQAKKVIKKKGKLTEAHFAAMLEFEMKMGGSTEPSFETIAGAGANASLPHYRAGAGEISKGVPLLVDWGALVGRYHSDMTRVVCFGEWPKKIREIYKVVLAAHDAAVAELGPGKTGKQIDTVARALINQAGYEGKFGHSLGHGIGLDIHEEPRLSQLGEEQELLPGMVVTVEPGIYLPGVGGVRLENDYLITEKGSRCLCELPMDLDWATRSV